MTMTISIIIMYYFNIETEKNHIILLVLLPYMYDISGILMLKLHMAFRSDSSCRRICIYFPISGVDYLMEGFEGMSEYAW